jgi:hypothetical protein
LEATTEKLIKVFESLEESGKLLDKSFSDFFGGDLKESTYEEFKALQDPFLNPYLSLFTEKDGTFDEENPDTLVAIAQYLESKFGLETLQSMGFKFAGDAATEFIA